MEDDGRWWKMMEDDGRCVFIWATFWANLDNFSIHGASRMVYLPQLLSKTHQICHWYWIGLPMCDPYVPESEWAPHMEPRREAPISARVGVCQTCWLLTSFTIMVAWLKQRHHRRVGWSLKQWFQGSRLCFTSICWFLLTDLFSDYNDYNSWKITTSELIGDVHMGVAPVEKSSG